MSAPRDEGPPRLYAWTTSVGPAGVTSDRDRALELLRAALTSAGSDATGTVDRVELDSTCPRYVYVGRVAAARWHSAEGRISWVSGDRAGT
ncbi:hypothetical protein [Spirillospora sp. CA-294931]|uniref:hypothetical protein n=1 Tax=Spirillospora sp. CA-294931 TaxID=3240042 RepID=UPI003D950263